MHTTLLVTQEIVKPCMRSLISCMRCSVYVHHKASQQPRRFSQVWLVTFPIFDIFKSSYIARYYPIISNGIQKFVLGQKLYFSEIGDI